MFMNIISRRSVSSLQTSIYAKYYINAGAQREHGFIRICVRDSNSLLFGHSYHRYINVHGSIMDRTFHWYMF